MALLVFLTFVSPRRGRDRRRRGDLYPTLDLHGETGDEAVRRSRQWLQEQQLAGVRTVQLITGRGLRSAGPPVLRLAIEVMLRSLREDLVEGFHSTAAGGAFLVELRPPRRSTTRVPPKPRIEPDLRRAAEEALAELGIRPTPELVEAEVRRMRRQDSSESA